MNQLVRIDTSVLPQPATAIAKHGASIFVKGFGQTCAPSERNQVSVPEFPTAYLKNGGTLEKAAAMANHASTRTTQLYDRRHDEVTLDEVERVGI